MNYQVGQQKKNSIFDPAIYRIQLIDRYSLVLRGLRELIEKEENLTVCYHGTDEAQGFKAVLETHPDLLIVDPQFLRCDGIELISAIHRQVPALPVLVLTACSSLDYQRRAFLAGANGYVWKSDSPEIVLAAIFTLLNGELYVSSHFSSSLN